MPPQRLLPLLQLPGPLQHLLLQGGVERLQSLLGPPTLLEFPRRVLEKARIVDGDRRLGREAAHGPFRPLREDARPGVSEEKASDHFA